MNDDTILSSPRAHHFGKRGAARVKAEHTYLIEGKYVTAAEIAERLGIHDSTARKRLRSARQAVGPLTWATLQGKK